MRSPLCAQNVKASVFRRLPAGAAMHTCAVERSQRCIPEFSRISGVIMYGY